MDDNIYEAHVYGYRSGLDGNTTVWEGTIDYLFTGDVMLTHPEHRALSDAFIAGMHDGYLRYIKQHPDMFLSPEQAAARLGIELNNLFIFLRKEERTTGYLFKSTCEGEGRRKVWYLHVEDVDAFPIRARRKSETRE